MISFPNIVKASKYRLEADDACLRARIAGNEVSVPWNSIQELSFAEHETRMLSVGYVRVVGTDGKEIAWTDHKLLLQVDKSYWEINTFQVPRSDESTIPLLSVERGLLLASIVIERAGLVEHTDGTFVRPDAMEAPLEETAGPEHESPDDVLQKVGSASKRVKQVLLLLAGFAAASWMWGVHFAIAILVYLMIHEYGHVVAMKWCGVRVSGIFVLPFMGAVAVSEEEASTHWKAFLIAYMGPVFGAVITLVAAIALFASGGQTPILREVAISWAAISIFNLLPLGVLDGGRIVMSISFSTHRAVGILESFATALLCVLAALSLKSWLLGIVALAAFMEMIHANSQYKLTHRLTKMGCDSEKIRKALLACWERLGRVGAEGSRLIAKRAQNAKLKVGFLSRFLSGKLETPKMTLLQIVGAIALYLGLFVFFVTILALASSVKASVDHYNRESTHVKKDEYDQAIAEFNKAIEINPSYAIVYDSSNHMVLSAITTRGPGVGINQFERIMTPAVNRYTIEHIFADAGYDSESNHRFARETHNIKSTIPPRHGRPTTKPLRGKYCRLMQQKFDQETYGQHWQVETVFSMIKRNQGEALRSKTYGAQNREMMLKVLTHNIGIILFVNEFFYRAYQTPLIPVSSFIILFTWEKHFRYLTSAAQSI